MKQRGSGCVVLLALLLGMLIIAGISMPLGVRANERFEAGKDKASGTQDRSRIDLKRGRRLFIRDCAHCHGTNGDGDSPVRRSLHPAPLDLTGFDLTESYILNVLHDGVPGSDMPAWHSSPEKDLRTVSGNLASRPLEHCPCRFEVLLVLGDALFFNENFQTLPAGQRLNCAPCRGRFL